jgi:hypothetical protein
LVHIANAYHIFDSKKLAIDYCIARFDEDTKLSFKEFYDKIDGDEVVAEDPSGESDKAAKALDNDLVRF